MSLLFRSLEVNPGVEKQTCSGAEKPEQVSYWNLLLEA
jgi:hypothetical protein